MRLPHHRDLQPELGELEKPEDLRELWRRQCARNMMDCYAAGLEVLSAGIRGREEKEALEALTRLMVDGMTVVRSTEDERVFYRLAAKLCRACAGGVSREHAGLF